MVEKNPYDVYKNNKVFTASKEELTLMLYDGGIKFCNQAITAIEQKNIPKAHEFIMRAEDIVREFQFTLNRNYEISKSFDSLYDYMYRRLVEANIRKDVAILSEVRDFFREFRDMWSEAMKLAKSTPRE